MMNYISGERSLSLKGSGFLQTFLLFFVLLISGSLKGQVHIFADSVQGNNGSQVVVPVRANSFTNLVGMQGTIGWNTSIATYDAVINFGLPNMSVANFGVGQTASGLLTFSWDDPTFTGVSVPDSTILFEIRFNVVGSPGFQTPVSFLSSPTQLEFTDNTFNTIPFSTQSGEIEVPLGANCAVLGVQAGTQGPCDIQNNLYTQDVTVTYANEPATGSLVVNGQSFPITSSPQTVTLTGLTSDGQPVNTTASFSADPACSLVVNNLFTAPAACGQLFIFADSVQGNTGSQVIVPVRVRNFIDLIGAQGTIDWNTSIVSYDTVFQYGLPGMNISNFGTALTGSGRLTFSWDDATFQGVTVADSTVIFALRFDVVGNPGTQTPIGLINSPTTLEFLDNSFNTVPFSATNGEVEILVGSSCAVLGLSAGSQTACDPQNNTYTQQVVVTYANAPASGTLDVNGQSFPITSSPQTVTLTGLLSDGASVDVSASFSADPSCSRSETGLFTAPAACGQLLIIADSLQGNTGSQVIVPVRVRNFIDMIGAQGTIEWNTAIVSYDTVFQYGLPGMNISNFGTALTASGRLTFSWDDATFQGVTVADSTVIFAIRYDIVGNPGTMTPISFINSPTNMEFSDNTFNTVPFSSTGGEVEVLVGANCAVLGLAAGSQSACDPQDNSYSQDIVVTYANAPASGTLDVNGQNFPITSSPQTVTLTGLNSNGAAVNVTASFSADPSCSRTEAALFTAPAACGQLLIIADSVQGTQGGQVTVPVRVRNFVDLVGAQGTIEWNTAVATYNTAQTFGLPSMNIANFGTAQIAAGRLTFSWDDPTFTGVTVADSAVIFELVFDVVGGPGTATPVNFVNVPTPMEFTDNTFNTVGFFTRGGEIEVPLGANCAVLGVQAGAQGACDPQTNTYTQQVVVNYANEPASGTLDVNGQSFPITSSPQTVTLTGLISDGQPVNVTASFSADPACSLSTNGLFTAPANCGLFQLFADSVQGATGSQVIVPVRVKHFLDLVGLQGTMTWNTTVADFDTVFQYGLPNMNVSNFGLAQVASGQMTFSWDDPTFTGVNVPDSTVIFAMRFDVVGGPGSITPVSFASLPTQLEVTDNTFNTVPFDTTSGEIEVPISGCAITNLQAGLQSPCNNLNNTYSQEVIVTYTTPPATGFLVVNGQAFPITNSPQTVTLTGLNSDGQPVDVSASFSADPACFRNQTAVFTAPFTCISTNVTLFADSVQAATGFPVIVPVRVRNFNDLIGMQGTVGWNTAIATYDTVFQYGLPSMSIANFGTAQVNSGQLTFSWDDPTFSGVSVSDSSTIFAIRFNVIGSAGSQTPVQFVNSPTFIEFTDNSFNTVPFDTISGEIDIPTSGIVTNPVAGTSFCVGDTILVPFTANGVYNAGNVFTAQLSNASGSFAVPTAIGTLNGTSSGTIVAVIPNVPGGTAYRVRVVSSNPVVVGSDNGTNLTISNIQVSANASICDGDSILLGGAFQTTAGVYVDTLVAGNGCDSVVTTTLVVNPVFAVADTAAICAGDSIFLGGAFQTSTGSYVDTLTSQLGCDSIVTTFLDVTPSILTSDSLSICDGDSAFLGGAFQTTAGSYVDSLTASGGCDSIHTTVLIILPNASNTVSVGICDGDSVFAGGAFQTTAGTYLDTLTAGNGCDSVLSTVVTVFPTFAVNDVAEICAGDSILLGGSFQTTAGNYVDTLQTVDGCDSVVTTTLTVLPNAASTVQAAICDGDSIFLGGAFQTTSGSYVDTLLAGNGCDSVRTTVLTVNPTFAVNDNAQICDGDSIFLGGAFQTTAGNYVDTLQTVNGCDSVVTTSLQVLTILTSSVNAEICDGDSIFLAGAFQTTSGSYVDTLTAASGCDSLATTVLTVLPNSAASASVSICDGDSVFLAGAFQTTSGVYVDTLVAGNGCDSVLTTTLTVLPNAASSQAVNICDGDSILLGGAFQTTSGIYTDTLLAGNGCDSVITTTLTVLPNAASTVQAAICDGDSIFLGGAFQTTAGSYVDTLLAGNGCDSVRTTVLTVNPTFAVNDNAQICAGDSIFLGGAFQTTAGNYVDTLQTVNGCDSVVTTTLQVLSILTSSVNAEICDGDSIFLAGAFQTTSGSYVDTLVAASGCDSLATTVLTVLPNSAASVNVSICDGDSVFLAGAFQTVSGVFVDTLVSGNGCDSVLTTTLTVLPNAASSQSVSICDGDSVLLGGAFQTTSGIYTDTLVAGNGCDSVITTTLTVLPNAASTVQAAICDGDSIFLAGAFQTTAGSYVDTLLAGNGCDSVRTTVLTVNPTFAVNDNAQICAGDSIFLGGAFQTTAGTYVDTLLTVNGCDSVVTTSLQVLTTLTSSVNAEICDGDSIFLAGAFQTTSGSYVDTLIAASGCDSLATTVLTVLPNSAASVNVSICDGDSVFLAGAFQTASGVFVDTLVSGNGCDSVLTTTLTVLPNAASSQSVSICDGDSVLLGGAFQTTSGIYTDTLVAGNGCDSVITTTLTVLPNAASTVQAAICDGDSIFLAGAFQTAAGSYVDTLLSGNGCDSVRTTVLTVNPTFAVNDSAQICAGDSIFLGGAFQSTSGNYVDTLQTVNGCDSVVTTNLQVLLTLSSFEVETICDGDSILLGGAFQTLAGIYVDTLVAVSGCDSIATTQLTVLPNSASSVTASICDGDSIFLGGGFQTTSGVYMDTLISGNGCDSVVTTTLTVLPNSATSLNVDICDGDSFFVAGAFQTVSGIYTDTLVAANGCDSVITTNLTVLPNASATVQAAICDGDSIFLGGAFQTTAGSYLDTLVAANGCDSVLTTVLTVNPNFNVADVAAICDGDSIFLSGAFQTTAGAYVDTLTTAFGCDSVVTTTLTILPNVAVTVFDTICDGDSYLLPGGGTATVAGTYVDTLLSSVGCDSVVTTELFVHPVFSQNVVASICAGDSYTLPGGGTVTLPGFYTDILNTVNGCDSVINTQLIVNPTFNQAGSASICPGDSVQLPGGSFVSTAGVYTDSLQTGAGCDSIIVTTVTVSPTYLQNVSAAICDGDNYTLPGGAVVNTAGTYNDTLNTSLGCDSIIVTTLTVNPTFNQNVNATICDGDVYTLPGGSTATTAGTYNDTLQSSQGCDSVIVTVLTVNPSFSQNVSDSICDGDSYTLPGGTVVTTGGVYNDTLSTALGCDSIIVTTLTVTVVDVNVGQAGNTLTVGAANAQYQWVDCAAGFTPIAGATNQSYDPPADGDYAVIVTLNGCTDTSACVPFILNAVFGSDFGASIQVYPNPSGGLFEVDLGQAYLETEVEVIDARGKVALRRTFAQEQLVRIDIRDLADGVYLLRVTSDNRSAALRVMKVE